jgi:hypothetical protein
LAENLRFSRRVPTDGVNLAWIELPPLNVVENISLVETAKFIAENINLVWNEKLDQGIAGNFVSTDSLTGFVLTTSYNSPIGIFPPSGSSVYAGVSTYAIPRQPTTSVTPSGYVIENFTSEIRVLHPAPNDTQVWRLRIQDGVIVRHYIVRSSDNSWLKNVFSGGDELVCFYSIPYALRIPYINNNNDYEDARVVDVSGVLASVIDERTIQLPDLDLYEVSSLIINGQQQITSSSGFLSVTTPVVLSKDPPRGPFTAWNPVEGTLTLSRSVDDRDIILVNYKYREYLYTYEGYLDDLGVYHDLDLNPSKGHTYDSGRSTNELLNIPIYLYLVPTAAYRYKDAGGNFSQDRSIYTADRWTQSFLRWEKTYNPVSNDTPIFSDPCRKRYTYGSSYFGSAKFVDSISVETLSQTASGIGLANQPSAIILAKLYVTSNAQVENVKILDTRSRGGGLPLTVDPTDVKLPGATRREAGTYWDISGWDGQPLPLGGVLLVELPGGLLTGTGGYPQFSQDEIETIVRQHVAAGIRVIVRYV